MTKFRQSRLIATAEIHSTVFSSLKRIVVAATTYADADETANVSGITSNQSQKRKKCDHRFP
jgi:hypothetical protein